MACRRNTLKWATRCCCSSFAFPHHLLLFSPSWPSYSMPISSFARGPRALDSRYKYIAERCGIRSSTQREREIFPPLIFNAQTCCIYQVQSGPILEYAARIAPFFIFSMLSRSTFMSVFPPTCIKGTSK